MPDKPPSPFSGLDKALLRSTRPQSSTSASQPVEPAQETTAEAPESSEGATGEKKRAPTRARTHARGPAPTGAPTHGNVDEDLYRGLQAKQRLASSTFRFRPQELEELDAVFAELDARDGPKLSKNDLVRLGLNWLLADYRANGQDSVLVRVLART